MTHALTRHIRALNSRVRILGMFCIHCIQVSTDFDESDRLYFEELVQAPPYPLIPTFQPGSSV